jgi:iron complex outermembrane receptor protein
MRNESLIRGVLIVTCGFVAAPLAVAQDQETSSQPILEEVIVTAQRREESNQEVPISITAFSGTDLERKQIMNTVDIVHQVPNLNGNTNVGLATATSFFLRGVGQDESTSSADPAVGTYVDGVYIARQISNNAYLYDVERVEVLRGPQGTLYGRNTSGGAVRIITRKPEPGFSGYIQAGYGEFGRYEFQGVVNGSLSDTTYAKVTAFYIDQNDGIQHNISLGIDQWDQEASGVRGQIRFEPNDAIDLIISAEYAQDEGSPIIGSNALGTTADDLFTVQSGLEGQFAGIEQWSITANLTWRIGNGMDLASITAYRDLDHDFLIDFADLPAPFAPGFSIPNNSNHTQFSQEFQLTGESFEGRFPWVVGVFYMSEDNDVLFGEDIFGGLISSRKHMQNDAETLALFAQGTFDITDRFSLTLGARYTDEERNLLVDGSTFLHSLVTGLPFDLTLEYDESDVRAAGNNTALSISEFTPKAALEFQQTDDIMWFVSYTEGFKSGGWNSRVTSPADFVDFSPEFVDSFEFGIKSEWVDNRLRVNLTYFNAQYDDFIVTAVNPLTGQFVTVNAAEAEVDGFEGEFLFAATDSLNFFANFGTMDGEYKQLDPAVPVPITNDMKRTPELSYLLGFNWDHELANANGSLNFTGTYSYQDEYFNGFANAPTELSPKQKLVNLTAMYMPPSGRWAISAGCRNCTDEEYFHSTLDFSALGFATQFPGLPRTWIATFRYYFAVE